MDRALSVIFACLYLGCQDGLQHFFVGGSWRNRGGQRCRLSTQGYDFIGEEKGMFLLVDDFGQEKGCQLWAIRPGRFSGIGNLPGQKAFMSNRVNKA